MERLSSISIELTLKCLFFQLATEGGVALTEGEKLSQELQLIEQGIREREHQLRMVNGF